MEYIFDPHALQKRMEGELRKLQLLPEPNRAFILDFLTNYRYQKRQLGIARKSRLASQLHFFAKMLDKPLKPFVEEDVKELVKRIERYENTHKHYALHTWREIVKNIKIWVKWVNPDKYPSILLNCKDTLTVQNPYLDPKRKAVLEDFLITDETFLKLLNVADVQQRALLAIGFGCGPRAGELLGLRRKDLKFNSDGTVHASFFESKTFPRENILLSPDLAMYARDWFDKSPLKNPNDFFFCRLGGEPKPVTNQVLNLILKRLSVRAGLGKWKHSKTKNGVYYRHYEGPRIFFTKFRRAAATWALKNLKSHALAGKRIWGNEATGMIRVYSGLISEDANEAYREAKGLVKPEAGVDLLKPKTCFQCGMIVPLTQSLCPKCHIETDTAKLLENHAAKEAEMLALREEMKMMQIALKNVSEKLLSAK